MGQKKGLIGYFIHHSSTFFFTGSLFLWITFLLLSYNLCNFSYPAFISHLVSCNVDHNFNKKYLWKIFFRLVLQNECRCTNIISIKETFCDYCSFDLGYQNHQKQFRMTSNVMTYWILWRSTFSCNVIASYVLGNTRPKKYTTCKPGVVCSCMFQKADYNPLVVRKQ